MVSFKILFHCLTNSFIYYTESIFKKVGFHVQKYREDSDDRTIKETVAAIVQCNSEEILIEKYHFFGCLFLSMKEEYVRKLLIIRQQEREKLKAQNIDYFIVDYYITVCTESSKGKPYCNGKLDVILYPTLKRLNMTFHIAC